MYQNIYYQRNKNRIHLWDESRGYSSFPYKRYAYRKASNGQHVSLYGDKLELVTGWRQEEIDDGLIFESDVPVETRVLIDIYGSSDDSSEGHRELFIDIEVESSDGFPVPSKAANVITATTLYDRISDTYFVFVLDEHSEMTEYQQNNVIVEPLSTEHDLIKAIYTKWIEIALTIVIGWNVDGFDIPYLYNRTVKVLGEDQAKALSPIHEVYWNEHKERYVIAGVSVLDYLALYKNFTYSEQSSYTLNAIGKKELNKGKIDYDGTLDDLFRDDIEKFIEYNVRDVAIVVELDEKLKLLELARGICHKGHVPYEDIYMSSRFLEGAILTYLKQLGVVTANKPADDADEHTFIGAYVKEPVPGLYKWVYDLDLTSLYPSVIMSLNISPETKIGKVLEWDAEQHVKSPAAKYEVQLVGRSTPIKMTGDKFQQFLADEKFSIASNGVLYSTKDRGLLSTILSTWFDERVEFRQLMAQYADSGDKAQAEYFKQRQHIQKILLNSLYGVLGLPSFRFYDLDSAAAVTTTGRQVIKFTQKMGNYWYNQRLNTVGDKDFCIYTDTDSVFFSALPIITAQVPDINTDDDQKMIDLTIKVAGWLQQFLNSSYDLLAKQFMNIDTHRFDIKQELVSKSALWIAKKRYAQWVVDENGISCDKLDVKGLDVVRSNYPIAFRKFMSEVLENILKGVDQQIISRNILTFKQEFRKLMLIDIAKPTGVNGIEKYFDSKSDSKFAPWKKGTPAHVKASIAHNILLGDIGLAKRYRNIGNGEKIKWVYLTDNQYKFDAIAFTGIDDPPELMEFIGKYVNYEKIFERELRKKLGDFYDALKWDFPSEHQAQAEQFFQF